MMNCLLCTPTPTQGLLSPALVFPSLPELVRHTLSAHSKQLCHMCGDTLSGRRHTEDHVLITHLGNNDKRKHKFKCPARCGWKAKVGKAKTRTTTSCCQTCTDTF